MWTSSMMIGGRRPPFTESGTFETDLDGWSVTSGSVTWLSTNTRTAPGACFINNGTMEYVIDKSICGGLTITASIWHKWSAGSAAPRTLSYKLGSGSYVTIATVTDSSASYAQFSGSFENPGHDDVTIKMASTGGIAADDWSISGV